MNRLVVFDVDSTLLSVESLDFAVSRALSSASDGAQRSVQLSEITDQGMSGAMDFRTSLEKRLAIAGLTRGAVEDAREALRSHLTPGMADLLDRLRSKGHDVAAVSGGFSDLIAPALADLGLFAGDIRANRFVYDGDDVVGFDRNNPLSRSGGKGQVVAALKALTGKPLAVMVGDGMTDYEAFASGAADSFIGFGAIAVREPVRATAPAFAHTVEDLRKLLLG
jgi:HAD superfamily phosphoserine phosphatase-like hydrolase